MKTDLHIHTNCSDGSLSPEQIVERACGAGLDAIAVTDHDNANGVERAVLAARGKPLKVVAGIELSAYDRDMETHVLGLGIDYAGESLQGVHVEDSGAASRAQPSAAAKACGAEYLCFLRRA